MIPRGLFRSLPHLARRFFRHIGADPLTPSEQDWVSSHLRGAERGLFWAQSFADQRHAFETGKGVSDVLGEDTEAVRAGLLHDVGKRHTTLGPVRRSLATLADAVGMPSPTSWRRYRHHGSLGAVDLEAAGSGLLVVAFAGHHPGPPPEGIDTTRWEILVAADEGR